MPMCPFLANVMTGLLDKINSPEDLKKLPLDDLPQLAGEIRRLITHTVERNGGHLGSNLGTIDLTVALHYVFDFAKDRLVWDVGHQCYAHKILTGRKEIFGSLRQYHGLCGFPDRKESVYDAFNSGHAGTSISTALGLVCGDAHRNRDRYAVAVIGDGAIAAGMAFEALNHGGALNKNLLVILNDNKMSISPSVGAMANYFNRIRQSRLFGQARKETKIILDKIPLIGGKMHKALHSLKEIVAKGLVPGYLFEELGFQYFGPMSGHKIKDMIEILDGIKDREGPKLLHVMTQKGRGHGPAVRDPENYHSRKASVPVGTELGKITREFGQLEGKSFTAVFSETLMELARHDDRIFAITAAMPNGTGLDGFAEEFPERYFNVGICEQHGLGLAGGLSISGMKPVVALYSTFLQRGYDQIFHDLCLQDADVTLAIDRAGIVGGDGVTHQGMFDIAYLRHLPGTILMAACDAGEMAKMLRFAVETHGVIALRYPRAACPHSTGEKCMGPIELGKAVVLQEGDDGAILAYGPMVYSALQAAELLKKEGINAAVVNARFAKPLDENMLADLVEKQPFILTLEDHVITGGFGSAVLEHVSDRHPLKTAVVRLGIPERFIEHGARSRILKDLGLNARGIRDKFKAALAAARQNHPTYKTGREK